MFRGTLKEGKTQIKIMKLADFVIFSNWHIGRAVFTISSGDLIPLALDDCSTVNSW